MFHSVSNHFVATSQFCFEVMLVLLLLIVVRLGSVFLLIEVNYCSLALQFFAPINFSMISANKTHGLFKNVFFFKFPGWFKSFFCLAMVTHGQESDVTNSRSGKRRASLSHTPQSKPTTKKLLLRTPPGHTSAELIRPVENVHSATKSHGARVSTATSVASTAQPTADDEQSTISIKF